MVMMKSRGLRYLRRTQEVTVAKAGMGMRRARDYLHTLSKLLTPCKSMRYSCRTILVAALHRISKLLRKSSGWTNQFQTQSRWSGWLRKTTIIQILMSQIPITISLWTRKRLWTYSRSLRQVRVSDIHQRPKTRPEATCLRSMTFSTRYQR